MHVSLIGFDCQVTHRFSFSFVLRPLTLDVEDVLSAVGVRRTGSIADSVCPSGLNDGRGVACGGGESSHWVAGNETLKGLGVAGPLPMFWRVWCINRSRRGCGGDIEKLIDIRVAVKRSWWVTLIDLNRNFLYLTILVFKTVQLHAVGSHHVMCTRRVAFN